MRTGTCSAKLIRNALDSGVEPCVRVLPREQFGQEITDCLNGHRMLHSSRDPGPGTRLSYLLWILYAGCRRVRWPAHEIRQLTGPDRQGHIASAPVHPVTRRGTERP